MDNDAFLPTKEKFSSTESSSLGKTWTNTKINVVKASHTWTISNFSFLFDRTDLSLESEIFSAAVNDKTKWKLILRRGRSDFVWIELQLLYCERDFKAQCKLVIYGEEMQEKIIRKLTHMFTEDATRVKIQIATENYLLDAANQLLPNNELRMCCEVMFVSNVINISGLGCNPEFADSKSERLNNLGLLFNEQKLSDVKINVDGQTFQAHKAILAAASPVFLAMFECDMVESERNSINIDDMDEETLTEMLRFIYTGKVNNFEKVARTLFTAADKYGLDKLKQMCQKRLYKSLTIENACSILVLADLHSSEWLKAQIINFISLEPVNVMKTKDFNSMIESHPRLLVDIMCALSVK